MTEKKEVSKDIQALESAGRWLGERFEILSERTGNLLRKLMPSRNLRQVSSYLEKTQAVNALEAQFEDASQEELQQKTREFQERLSGKSTLR